MQLERGGGEDVNNLGNKKTMATNLQYYMDKNGIDRNKLCADLGLKYTTVCGWLTAEKYPRIDKIEILANYFGINKSDLVEVKVKREKLGKIFVDIVTALGLNIPEMQDDLGVDRKVIMRLLDNRNTFLEDEFSKLESAYGIPVAVWAGEITFGAWLHGILHCNHTPMTALYSQLNSEGKKKAVDLIDDMVRSGKYSA